MNASPPGDDSAIWDPPLDLSSELEDLNTPDQNIAGKQDEEPLELEPPLKLLAQLKDLKVRVSHVNSPSSFYVQFTQYDSHLKRLAVFFHQSSTKFVDCSVFQNCGSSQKH